MARILVFGDSIAFGLWDKQGGWASRLRNELDVATLGDPFRHIQLYNLGIAGDTSTGVLERCEAEIISRLPGTKEISIILLIGINDSQFIKSETCIRTSPEKFQSNILSLIKIAQKYTKKILIIGLTPVDETKTNPIPWSPDKFYNNERIRQYNKILKDICGEKKIPFVDILEKFKGKEKKLLFDGLHPNSKGHELIFRIVKSELEKNKII